MVHEYESQAEISVELVELDEIVKFNSAVESQPFTVVVEKE
jgi:hypothetical protein